MYSHTTIIIGLGLGLGYNIIICTVKHHNHLMLIYISSSYQSFLSPLAKCIHFFKTFSQSLWIPRLCISTLSINISLCSTGLLDYLAVFKSRQVNHSLANTLLLTVLPLKGYISVILTVSSPLSEISLSYLLVWLYVFETMIVILVRRTRSPSPLTNYIQYTYYYILYINK